MSPSLDLHTRWQETPNLLLIGGFQGSGKSSLIKRIARKYEVSVVSTDVIRKEIIEQGVKISPEFTIKVRDVYEKQLKRIIESNGDLIIDANAHAKRIEESNKMVSKFGTHYSTIKIFLNTSPEILRSRVSGRKATSDCYQGTLSDLEASLSLTKINLDDYDLIVETNDLSKEKVFDVVDLFISNRLRRRK